MSRVAVLGGTFDPVHLGHLAAAEQSRQALGAGEAWLIPAGWPPHRGPAAASAADRLDMLGAAIRDRTRLLVLDLEVRRPGPSYAVDTLEQLEFEHPGEELWLVVGADAAATVGRWHRGPDLLARARFAIVNRAGTATPTPAEAARWGFATDRTRILRIDSPPIRSTAVRDLAAAGRPLEGLVPADVAALIRERGLYRAPAAGAARA